MEIQDILKRRNTQVVIQIEVEELQTMLRDFLAEEFQRFKAEFLENTPLSQYSEYMTTNQVCEALQVSRSTLNSWAADPLVKLKKIDLEGKPRFSKTQVIGLLRNPIKGKRLY